MAWLLALFFLGASTQLLVLHLLFRNQKLEKAKCITGRFITWYLIGTIVIWLVILILLVI